MYYISCMLLGTKYLIGQSNIRITVYIQQLDLTVRDLVAGYNDDGEGGAVEFADKLGRFYVRGDIRFVRIVIRRKLN